MEIRNVKAKDLHNLVALCHAHAQYEKADYDDTNKISMLSKYLFDPAHMDIQCLVVEIEGVLVGYATFFRQFSTWDADHYVYLDCLYLKEEVRGMGIGTKIMDRVSAYTKSVNCNIIQWQTPEFNSLAIRFYKKLGGVPKTKERFTLNVN